MPVIQSYNSSNISDSASGNINTSFRYFKEGYHQLIANFPEIVVPATSSLVARCIRIENKGEIEIRLYWGGKNLHPKTLRPNEVYVDLYDGGNALVAESNNSCLIEILVRQNNPINYQIGNTTGEDEMVDLVMRPLFATGNVANAIPNGIYPDYMTIAGWGNIKNIALENDPDFNPRPEGGKGWIADSFTDNKEYIFTLDPVTTWSESINIYLGKTELLAVVGMNILAANANNEFNNGFGAKEALWEFVKDSCLIVNSVDVSSTLQQFNVKFYRTRHVLFFVDSQNQVLICSYTPNTDIQKGGTFTILGV